MTYFLVVTSGNNLLSCGKDLLSCGNDLQSCQNNLLSRGNDLIFLSNKIQKKYRKTVLCPFLGSVDNRNVHKTNMYI